MSETSCVLGTLSTFLSITTFGATRILSELLVNFLKLALASNWYLLKISVLSYFFVRALSAWLHMLMTLRIFDWLKTSGIPGYSFDESLAVLLVYWRLSWGKALFFPSSRLREFVDLTYYIFRNKIQIKYKFKKQLKK